MDLTTFWHDFFLILPEVELVLFGLAILLFDFMLGVRDKTGNAVFAMLGVIFSGFSLLRFHGWSGIWWLGRLNGFLLRLIGPGLGPDAVGGFDGSIVIDPFFIFFGMILLVATALVILLSA